MANVVGRLVLSNEARWGGAGWSFFILENALLSENRTYLREVFGDENYHLLYGFMSTLAMGSVGYSYYKLTKLMKSKQLSPIFTSNRIPTGNMVASWSLVSVGLILASQALPKMQIPIAVVSASTGCQMEDAEPSSEGKTGYKIQVRCPFDFSDKHRQAQSADGSVSDEIRGMERVTRHPGLWSFGLVFAGNAMLQSNAGLRLWWMGPAAVAWLGGMHSDSRFRRGIGGHLDPVVDSQTSNIPFLALLSGKQGAPTKSFEHLISETKPLNATIALVAATTWVLSRGRFR